MPPGALPAERHARRVRSREGLDRVHLDEAGAADRLPGRFALPDRPEELAVLEHLGPDALVDAAAQVLDELAVDVLGHRLRRSCRRRSTTLGRPRSLPESRDELDVVEPGLARRPAPAAEKAGHFEGVVGAGIELDVDPASSPVCRRDRRRPPVVLAVDVDLGAAARARDEVLRLDPAAEPIARIGPDRDGREPRGVGALRAEEIVTLRPPLCAGRSRRRSVASPSRCQLRAATPLGFWPSISSNEPLTTNWVTPASSSPTMVSPDLQPAMSNKSAPAARTIEAREAWLWRAFTLPPPRPGWPAPRVGLAEIRIAEPSSAERNLPRSSAPVNAAAVSRPDPRLSMNRIGQLCPAPAVSVSRPPAFCLDRVIEYG